MGKHVGRRQSAEGEWKRVPALSKPWPLLLKYMELAGTPGEIKITKSRVLIRGTSPQTAWMGGHARKSPWRKRAGLALASFGLLCLLFLPIGASNHNVKAVIKAPKPTIDLCGLGQVKDQLLGLKPLTSVKLGKVYGSAV